MATIRRVPDELLEQLRGDRAKIAAELPELLERGKRMDEAVSENSLSGHLRRAIHRSGLSLKKIAESAGMDVFLLRDFLEGTRTLRSDVLDRLAQAIGARVELQPSQRQVPESSNKSTDAASGLSSQ